MEHTAVDDVDVLRLDLDGPLRAQLIFRAGTGHATLRTHPAPHLLEHLLLGALPDGSGEIDGSTGEELLSLEVTGTPAQVRDALHGLCAGIRNLPLERLEHEARVIEIEDAHSAASLAGLHAVVRHGPRGAGLTGLSTVSADQITPEQVREHAVRTLVAENAVLTLTGPVPEGLRLDLPHGSRAKLVTPRRLDLRPPFLLHDDVPVVSLSLEVPRTPATALLARMLHATLRASLRQARGIAYDVGLEELDLDADRMLWVLAVDHAPQHAEEVAAAAMAALREIADGTGDLPELAAQQARLREAIDDPRTHDEFLTAQAARVLRGERPLPLAGFLAEIGAVAPSAVREAARRALGTVVVLAPEDAEISPKKLRLVDGTDDPWDDEPEMPGVLYRRRLVTTAPRDLRVRLGEDGLSIRYRGLTTRFDWASLAGVELSEGWYELIREDGRTMGIDPGALRGGAELIARLEERVGHLFFTAASD